MDTFSRNSKTKNNFPYKRVNKGGFEKRGGVEQTTSAALSRHRKVRIYFEAELGAVVHFADPLQDKQVVPLDAYIDVVIPRQGIL